MPENYMKVHTAVAKMYMVHKAFKGEVNADQTKGDPPYGYSYHHDEVEKLSSKQTLTKNVKNATSSQNLSSPARMPRE